MPADVTSSTDLPAAADTLSRAADLIEKLVGRADSPGETKWFTADELSDPNGIHHRDAELIETFGPYVVAALVPLLRLFAGYVHLPEITTDVDLLLEFARRLLREEET